MRSQLIKARHTLLRLAGNAGVTRVFGSTSWRTQRLLILCYHGVSLRDEHLWSDLYVPQSLLDERLKALKRLSATVLPLEEALPLLEAGQLPPRAVSLTFDDGTYDFLAKAQPVLKAHDVRAMLYFTTYYADREMPVFNPMASYLMWKGGGRTIRMPMDMGTVLLPESTKDPRHQALHDELRRRVRELPVSEKNEIARQLAALVGEDYDELCALRMFHIMRTSDLQQVDTRLVSVQLHTHRHRVPRDAALFRQEIEDNQRIITRMLGTTPDALQHFCYPSGEHYGELLTWLRSTGVISATTCVPGLATIDSHPLLLPRFVDTFGVPQATFDAWVLGLGAAVTRKPGLPLRNSGI